jgi:hypothetical protein
VRRQLIGFAIAIAGWLVGLGAAASPSLASPAAEEVHVAQAGQDERPRFRRPGSREVPDAPEAREPQRDQQPEVPPPQQQPEAIPTDADEPEIQVEPGPRPTRAPRAGDVDYEFLAVPDRWRIVESMGVNERWWDPFHQNTLKGDRPVFGTQDWFVNLTVVSDTLAEFRRVPTLFGVQINNNTNSLDIQGDNEQLLISQTLLASFSIIQGDTAFRPPDFEFRVSGAGNVNYANNDTLGVLYINPEKGDTRTDLHFGFTELFVEKHLFDLSPRYDFMSVRAGIQAFSTDFRGFLYSDNNLGVRVFGDLANNRLQYNFAYFRRIEKDTNSGLPKVFDLRDDDVVIANLYYQDFPIPGFTLQTTAVYNRNREGRDHFDENGFKMRPSPAGTGRPHEYDVVYLGVNGDGHFDRLNLTFSLYYATGHDDDNFLAARSQQISSWFFAGEASYDFDWWRLKVFGMWASGDRDPLDDTAAGFDAIFDNPQFAGAETSFWHRQAVPLIFGGGTLISGRDSLLASLRTSKDEGQSNFVNPGLGLVGVGADFDVLPELRLVANVSYLRFDHPDVLEELRQQNGISREIGWDLSGGIIYRPLFINNIILRASGSVLLPGAGLQDLYKEDPSDPFYSVVLTATLAY